jgi:ABC-type nitrate/sulfonate/bicarbonate transport system ATPase subunit
MKPKGNAKETESESESETINKKMNTETINKQTKLNDLEMSVPKKVTAGWARRVVMCRALSC